MLGTSSTSGALAERISGCQCFQLTYQSLEGYANLLERKLEVGGVINRGCYAHGC